jgi:1,4-alpha-glucan branching enzyme
MEEKMAPKKIAAKKTVPTKKETVKRRRIDFVFDAPEAQEVYLAGTFNDWSFKKHRMKKNGDGLWRKSVILPNGVYEYKFLVDGRWTEDPANERRCLNSFGSLNSIVHVPE